MESRTSNTLRGRLEQMVLRFILGISESSDVLKSCIDIPIHIIIVHQADQVITILYLPWYRIAINITLLFPRLPPSHQLREIEMEDGKGHTSSSICLEASASWNREAHTLVQMSKASSFQTMKLTGSTTVGWIISFAGKTPQVTAFTLFGSTFEMLFPSLFTAM